MLASSLIDYALGRFVASSDSVTWKRVGLTASIVCNLGLLGFFKYYNFFAENLVHFLGEFGWTVHPIVAEIILPVGISFYTFQTLSYTIDIYRGNLQPTRNIIDYLAFVSFFPQLVAGPIERATNLIPQFTSARTFAYENAISGCQSILWGFFKKLVIADRLAMVVDAAFLDPANTPGIALLLATIFFAFQIYCDFSAYSDIAIGTAKLFNIHLMRNFDYPYFSTSVTEFWRRWHISLSTWFRDYVFIPLGGSQCSNARTNLNLMITFVLSGLWHGAAWKFVIWGGINGLALIAEKTLSRNLIRTNEWLASRVPTSVHHSLKTLITFGIICLGWVFFRADNWSEACAIVSKICLIPIYELNLTAINTALEFQARIQACMAIVIAMVGIEWLSRNQSDPLKIVWSWPLPIRWATYTALFWLTFKFMVTTKVNPFIYFTF